MSADDRMLRRGTNHLGRLPSGQYLTRTAVLPLDAALPWVIELRVVGTASTIQLQLRETMLLGRDDPEHNFHAEIDLTPFQAFANGVSRKHALIQVQDGRVSVKDLSSTNGSRLNAFSLLPGVEYQLQHGDELSLGELRLQVQFAVVPAHDAYEDDDDAQDTPTEPALRAFGRGRRVLVVEDDADVSMVFRMGLERAGFKVTIAPSASLVVEEVAQRAPDAIIMDLMLPGLSGLDLIQYVRRQEQHRRVPVIAVSAATGGFQRNKALENGADAFLGKPISMDELGKAGGDALGL